MLHQNIYLSSKVFSNAYDSIWTKQKKMTWHATKKRNKPTACPLYSNYIDKTDCFQLVHWFFFVFFFMVHMTRQFFFLATSHIYYFYAFHIYSAIILFLSSRSQSTDAECDWPITETLVYCLSKFSNISFYIFIFIKSETYFCLFYATQFNNMFLFVCVSVSNCYISDQFHCY